MKPLESLRVEIDQIDDALHDLLMKRARLVEDVRRSKIEADPNADSTPVSFFRPAREAHIIRRLMSRHQGSLPAAIVGYVWRQLISAYTAMQTPFIISVFAADMDHHQADIGMAELARQHFGVYARLVLHRSERQTLGAVTDGYATMAVLPFPSGKNTSAWWVNLMAGSEKYPRVVSCLPFVQTEHIERQAVALACLPVEATEHDKTWLGLEISPDASRTRLVSSLTEAGFLNANLLDFYEHEAQHMALVEVEGWTAPHDDRLQKVVTGLRDSPIIRVTNLGGYATPVASLIPSSSVIK